MKKILLSSLVLMMGAVVFGQTSNRSELKPAPKNVLLTKSHESSLKAMNSQKTLACVDTIRYPQTKEQILGTGNFYVFELWADDNESMSQTFLLSGSTLGITGVEFYGRNSPNGVASVSVRASVYNVDASNNPTTEIAFANITLTDTNFNYRQVNFTPINVSGNYAVVIRPTNVGGIVDFYVNDAALSQSYDENLSRAKSDWYTSSNGNWVNMPTYTVSGFTGGPFDFEMLAAPKITYTITTDFTASPNPSCLGTPVNFTNNTTPTSVLSSRFYNYQKFKNYFNTTVPDSTYVYALGGGASLVWNGTATHTYATAANHSPKLYTLGGFWNSCLDSATKTVTVNPLPTVTANATSTSVCTGSQVTLTGGGASSYTWNNGVTNGVAFTPTATTTYTVTGTDGNNCQNTAQVTVTVNPLPTVTANASATTVCAGGQVTLTGGGASSYTWDNGVTNGVAFTPAVTTTYTVTGTDGNNCQNTAQVTVTVASAITVTANATATSICAGDQVTLTGSGATSYAWDNGVTNGVAFTPTATTTYTVTGTSGSCTDNDQITITVTTVDATTTTTGTTITANNGNATYQWVDCDNSNQPISGATSQNFTPTVTGNYAVVVTENGCSETSACENIVITGLNEMNANSNISVYPNPVNDIFTISSSDDLSGTVVKIVAITGQTLVEKTIISGNTATFDMSVYATGLYFVEINQNGNLNTLKVIKK
jgi:type IX secretion system substrate protein